MTKQTQLFFDPKKIKNVPVTPIRKSIRKLAKTRVPSPKHSPTTSRKKQESFKSMKVNCRSRIAKQVAQQQINAWQEKEMEQKRCQTVSGAVPISRNTDERLLFGSHTEVVESKKVQEPQMVKDAEINQFLDYINKSLAQFKKVGMTRE